MALLRLADGNRRGADSALRAGMRMLSRYRAALGATELRVNAAGHAADLARLGLGLAVEEGDATRALAWAERWRAGTLGLRPERPPDDVELAADLAELRRVTGEVREAAAAGRDTTRLLNRQGALEEAVRRRAHRTPGQDLEPMELEPAMGTLGVALGERALIEIAALHGELHAVVVADGRARLRQLGQLADVSGELANLLKGEDARVDAVAAALDGAGLGHVAAHGRFRADNPFFSSLQLADGPLTVYDLEALRRAPARLILSACDSGLSAVRPGDELMGLAAAVFSLGTRTLIARWCRSPTRPHDR